MFFILLREDLDAPAANSLLGLFRSIKISVTVPKLRS